LLELYFHHTPKNQALLEHELSVFSAPKNWRVAGHFGQDAGAPAINDDRV
jgi:hypothetical protein